MSVHQPTQSTGSGKTRRPVNVLPLERNTSLGRVLDPSWRDQASPLYDCFDAALREQERDVGPWLARHKQQNQNNAVLKAAEAKFEAAMEVLHAHGSAYDPRLPDALLPLNGDAQRPYAVDAQRAWQDVAQLRNEAARWAQILDGAAEGRQREARRSLTLVREARDLHVRFIAEVVRKAMRWRVLGRIVMYGLRWMRRVLRGARGA